MRRHVDGRSFTVLEYSDLLTKNELRSVTIFKIDAGAKGVDLDDIWLIIEEELNAMLGDESAPGLGQYEICDRRERSEIGASAFLQNIILAISTGFTEGAAGSAITHLIQRLSRRIGRTQSSVDTPVLPAVDRASVVFRKYFQPQGILEVMEVSPTRIVMKDANQTYYVAEMMMENDPVTYRKLRSVEDL